jgi:hypothetical protein
MGVNGYIKIESKFHRIFPWIFPAVPSIEVRRSGDKGIFVPPPIIAGTI